MIEIRVLGDQVGIGTNNETGNAVVNAIDHKANTVVSIELTPEAWKAFVAAVPKLKGVGITIAGRVPSLVVPGNGN